MISIVCVSSSSTCFMCGSQVTRNFVFAFRIFKNSKILLTCLRCSVFLV